MTRAILLASGFAFFAGCSEYEFKAQTDAELAGQDTAQQLLDSGDPQDSAVDSDDPIVDTNGSEADSDLPVAVCDVSPNPVHPPFEDATWDGTESYDPQGATITSYDWTLTSIPSGSTSILAPNSGDTLSGFTPDLAGDYVAELVVTTDDGRVSDPCEVTLEAIPSQDLWIEMYWTTANDDMDLHLLDDGGSVWADSDCHWLNCTPTYASTGLPWGASGPVDNPTLDLDDISGTGPENINISSPDTVTFKVVVHDYPGSSYQPANDVTINIYMDGALEWTDTRAISGEDTFTEFAEIDWSTGTVTDL